ncbi:hypothetical protein Patl1_35876 [Pistacia atlantica]|nr:hypothetical protein Patl1_35876 [Pistacia atlantica]
MSSASLNVSNFVTLKLGPENYPLWCEQVLALAIKSLQIFSQEKTHAQLLGWIIGTLAEEALSHVIGLDTSAQVWAALKEALGARYEPFATSMLKPPMPSYNEDKLTQQVQMRGLKRGNLYAIRAPLVALFSSRFWVALEDIWHQRLGHVQAAAVAHLRNKALISTISNKDNSISAGIQPTTFQEFNSWSTPSCEHSDHFTQPKEEAPLPTPNA